MTPESAAQPICPSANIHSIPLLANFFSIAIPFLPFLTNTRIIAVNTNAVLMYELAFCTESEGGHATGDPLDRWLRASDIIA